MADLWLKAFHLVGLIFWVGGLLVTTRICAMHAVEAEVIVRNRYAALEKRFFWGMGTAGLLVALLTGVWLLVNQGFGQLDAATVGAGFHIKLTFVVLLIIVHFLVAKGITKLGETTDVAPAGKFKAYHVIISVLMLATLIAVLPIRQMMYDKKVQENAEKATTEAPVTAPTNP
jgi:putative membrane protein